MRADISLPLQVFADGMASTLDVLALCAEVAFRGVLPRAQRCSSDGGSPCKPDPAGQDGVQAPQQQQEQEQQQQQRQPSSHVVIELPELATSSSDSKLGANGSNGSSSNLKADSTGGGGGGGNSPMGACTSSRQLLIRLQRLSLSAAPVQVMLDVLEPLAAANPLNNKRSEPDEPRAFLVIGPDCEPAVPLVSGAGGEWEWVREAHPAGAPRQS